MIDQPPFQPGSTGMMKAPGGGILRNGGGRLGQDERCPRIENPQVLGYESRWILHERAGQRNV